ncbi:MAG: GYD domain-containing protein [Deltaproteobacteria bacterium]|nr:GYD domain-containing protein [Deltaproteobacteria bacterium]
MATFFMFGKYSAQAMQEMSPARTQKAAALIKQLGGEVKGMYALLGKYDLVVILTLPGIEAAMKASLSLSKLTGIGFTTCPAVTVEEFDKIIS